MAAKKSTKSATEAKKSAGGELRSLSVQDLHAKLDEDRQELFNLRFKHATAQLEKTSSISATRRQVARILTILKEKE